MSNNKWKRRNYIRKGLGVSYYVLKKTVTSAFCDKKIKFYNVFLNPTYDLESNIALN